MLSINTSLPSFIAQRSLSNSTKLLNQAIERMSTGYKINHASDNAANYSISTNMTTMIGAYEVAEDNTVMGLDLLTTAGESLSLISEHLSRIRDLTIQAGNGTYGKQSIKAINAEVNSRVDEIKRLYNLTEYNGQKLFGEISENRFMEDVVERDTSGMTALSDVDSTQNLAAGTYSVSTADELAQLSEMVNNGLVTATCEFVLANDIDLSGYRDGEGWIPIGTAVDGTPKFKGTFDGNGHVVKNLYINRPEEYFQALFGQTVSGSVIKNLAVENADVTGFGNASAVIGSAVDTTIENCYSTGNIYGFENNTAGIAGDLEQSAIKNSHSACNVEGMVMAGGLVGWTGQNCVIQNSYSSGDVKGKENTGGLVGAGRDITITNCYSQGNVKGVNSVGGFLGYTYNATTIENCYSTGSVSGSGSKVDDFIGNKTASVIVTDSGKITGDMERPYIYNPELCLSENKVIPINFQVGINASESSQIELSTAFLMKDIFDLRYVGYGKMDYLGKIDNLINEISTKQTEYGSAQNRLDSALEEISTQYDNLVSSRSTLRDADIAEVSSEYIRQQILQQAGATLLATANQSPALALQLL